MEVLKRKISRLFTAPSEQYDDRAKLFEVVNVVHRVVTNTTILIKFMYLEAFEACDGRDEMPITEDLVQTCFNVLNGQVKLHVRHKAGYAADAVSDADRAELLERTSAFSTTLNACTRLFGTQRAPTASISDVLSASMVMLLTAYKNNVNAHYVKYVRRYLLYL